MDVVAAILLDDSEMDLHKQRCDAFDVALLQVCSHCPSALRSSSTCLFIRHITSSFFPLARLRLGVQGFC